MSGTLSSEAIATRLMEIFDPRSEGSDSGLMLSPHVLTSTAYTALRVGDWTIWDSEDAELAHAEKNIRDVIAALQALVSDDGQAGDEVQS